MLSGRVGVPKALHSQRARDDLPLARAAQMLEKHPAVAGNQARTDYRKAGTSRCETRPADVGPNLSTFIARLGAFSVDQAEFCILVCRLCASSRQLDAVFIVIVIAHSATFGVGVFTLLGTFKSSGQQTIDSQASGTPPYVACIPCLF